jgi:hypothetical protein
VFTNLNSPRKAKIERGNEIWNTGNSSFAAQTEWIRRATHTRFSYTAASGTFTKAAHGYTDNQLFQSWATTSMATFGINADTQVATANWATTTVYTAGQFVRGDFFDDGVQYVCVTGHTASALFETDRAAGKWQRIEWYPLVTGQKLFIKVLTANTFELWTGTGATGRKCIAPTLITTLTGILTDEGGAIADELLALNTQYATLAKADWAAFDAAFGGTSRVTALIGAQASFPTGHIAQRLAVTGVAARCNHVAIAPYHNGVVWGGAVVPISGQITPYVWVNGTNGNSTWHCSIYTFGSTPTRTQRKAGTGTGFQTRMAPNTTVTSSGRQWTAGTAVAIANGTYTVFMDLVDDTGSTWSVSNTVVVGAAQPQVDFVDTDANQQLRDLYSIDTGDLEFISQCQAQIAASSNPAITIVNYEGGSHQDYYPPNAASTVNLGTAVDTWYRNHRESATYGDTLRRYYYCLAAAGVALHCHYMDVTGNSNGDTPWRIANSYTDTSDNRYAAVAAFGGAVPAHALVNSGTVTGTSYPTAPSYPAPVKTFADAAWTYSVYPKGDTGDGNYSTTTNVLSLTATGSINFATPATQSVWIYGTDGYTHTFFQVQYNTGAAWYSASSQVAWSKTTDVNAAVMDVYGGTSGVTGSPAATVVTDGWDLSGTASYDSGYGGTAIAYTSSPLFIFAGRPDGDTGAFQNVCKFGNGPFVQFFNRGTTTLTLDGSVTGEINISCTDVKTAFWVYFDNTNLKYYYGKGQTVLNVGGTAYASQGAATIPAYLRVGGDGATWIATALNVVPAANLTAALALVQALQTEVGA